MGPPSASFRGHLTHLASTVEHLLRLGEATDALKASLDALDEAILDLSEAELSTEWRPKLTSWWVAFARLQDDAADDDLEERAPRRQDVTSPPRVHLLSKESIHAQLSSAFAALPPVTLSTDIDGLERLLTLVATADKLISTDHYWRDGALQESLLSLALPKLPPDLRQTFTCQYRTGRLYRKTLWALDDFLKETIVAFYGALRQGKGKRVKKDGARGPREPLDADRVPACRYCKSPEHQKEACPKIQAQVCFKCYEMGHKAKYCTWSVSG